MKQKTIAKITVLILVLLVSVIFTIMIEDYLMTLLLAGVFAGLCQPVYRRTLKKTRGRKSLSSVLTLLGLMLIIIIPLGIILSLVVAQAIQVGQAVGPWIEQIIAEPENLISGLEKLPFYDYLIIYQEEILSRIGEAVSYISTFLVNSITQVTSSTAHAGFLFFIFIYTMFFFIKEGKLLIDKILYYLPLENEPEQKLLDHFTSVTKATLKGTFLIGLIQGTLAALGFWVAGIDSVVFWGMIMTVLSIIPIIGSSIVWIPTVIILAISGNYGTAIILGIYCAVIVGTVDNILRPILVGKDTKMHELFILLGTLGGIGLFGIWGVLIGPVIAALFVTVWDLYGKTFAEYLPPLGNRNDETKDVKLEGKKDPEVEQD